MVERFYPSEENLGKNCEFWNLDGAYRGCDYPKAELNGRVSCEGIVDDVCLFLKDGRDPASLSKEQKVELKTRIPTISSNRISIPPGNTTQS